MKLTLILLAFFMLGVIAPVSEAKSNAGADPAVAFVKQVTDKGLNFLSNPKVTETQKRAEFKTLLNKSFDLDTIGRFVLGRFWNSASASERAQYLGLFRTMIVDVYSNRFSEYKGQTLEILSSRPVGSDALVASIMKHPKGSGASDVKIDWRVRKSGTSYKIVDVIVEGVSMSVTQRSEFASIIQTGGGNIAALIDSLKKNDLVVSQ